MKGRESCKGPTCPPAPWNSRLRPRLCGEKLILPLSCSFTFCCYLSLSFLPFLFFSFLSYFLHFPTFFSTFPFLFSVPFPFPILFLLFPFPFLFSSPLFLPFSLLFCSSISFFSDVWMRCVKRQRAKPLQMQDTIFPMGLREATINGRESDMKGFAKDPCEHSQLGKLFPHLPGEGP